MLSYGKSVRMSWECQHGLGGLRTGLPKRYGGVEDRPTGTELSNQAGAGGTLWNMMEQ
jgi:hypothetical protein